MRSRQQSGRRRPSVQTREIVVATGIGENEQPYPGAPKRRPMPARRTCGGGVLHMVTVLHMIPTLEGGGAERQLYLLATEQARRGLSVHVAIRRGGVHMQAM